MTVVELHTRWIKILKDIWDHKSRSILVVLSIAVGVAAVGMINNAKSMIERDLYGAYQAGNPALVQVYVSPFDKNLAAAVSGMREVELAEARRTVAATGYPPAGPSRDINLTAVPDFNDVKIDQLTLESGAASPGVREILLERQSAQGLGVTVGDQVTIEINHQRRYALTVVGIVHDSYVRPFALGKQAAGYVSMDTLQWMGLQPGYNLLNVVVADNKYNREHVLAVAGLARDRVIEPAGYIVGRIQIPGFGSNPGQHWAQNQINGLLLVLQVMGVLTIFLTGGLVINTISAIMTQQIKQIGVMRSIGAVRGQIVGMYIVNVLFLSTLGLLIGLPLGLLGAWGLAELAANFLNFTLTEINLPVHVALLQAAVGLLMPIGVALAPIISGTRISVYDAIYEYGLTDERRHGLIESLLIKVRRLSPPIMLSLRNTFRNKARLVFTLITLTLAGAMFIAAFSTRSSLTGQTADIQHYVAFDAALNLPAGSNRLAVERNRDDVEPDAHALPEAPGVVGRKVAVDAVPDLAPLGLYRNRLAHGERAVGADRDLAAEIEQALGRAGRARGEREHERAGEPPHRSTLTASRSSVSKNGIGANANRRATSRSGNDCSRVRYCLTAPL